MNQKILAMVAALLVAATGVFYATAVTAEQSTAKANEYAPTDPGLKSEPLLVAASGAWNLATKKSPA